MRRRANVKLLICLLAGLAVTGTGLYFLYGVQLRRGAISLLMRADQAEEQGDRAKASECLKQYLTLRPDDGDALARYGLLLDQEATSPAARVEAFCVLQEAFRRPTPHRDVGRRLVQRAVDLGRYNEARAALAILLDAAPKDGELEEWCGRCD
jgi:tetratricopeptide (TPR) repeat protein